MKITIPYTGFNIDKFPPKIIQQIKNVFPERNKIFQPRVRFIVRSLDSRKSIIVEGIIDSGAEYCFFNHEIAEVLDIPIETGKIIEVCGVGGIRPAYFHKVEFTFNLFGSKENIIKYEINVGFFPKEEDKYTEPCLLGEYGFFNRFKVNFNLAKYNFELEPSFE